MEVKNMERGMTDKRIEKYEAKGYSLDFIMWYFSCHDDEEIAKANEMHNRTAKKRMNYLHNHPERAKLSRGKTEGRKRLRENPRIAFNYFDRVIEEVYSP